VDLLQLLILLIIAGLCGAIAEWIVGFSPGDLLVTIINGVVGAYVGSWVGSLIPIDLPLRVAVGTISFNLIWAVLGSIVLLLLLRTLRGTGRRSLSWRNLLDRRS
jgi:uncharacterized membrane protein YeaQ/YmgE (transglycosylase-associated protein family)